MLKLYDLRSNFGYYHDFYISAKEKSFSEASRKHNISQPSLSRSVSKLEHLLDLKLIKTSNRGFSLTLDGERLYKVLDGFFNKIDVFSAEQLSKNLDVVLTIGTTRNIADFVLEKYLTKFSRIFPNVKLMIYTDNASNLNEYLLNHKIDILIDYLPHINYSEKFDLEVKPCTKYSTCFACSKSFYKKIKDNIHSISDLENYTLVLPGSSRRRQMLDEFLQNNGIELKANHLMPDSKLMADFVKANDFIGYFIEEELDIYDLVKIELKEKLALNPIGIIYSKNTLNHIAREFVKIVLDE